MAVRRHLHFGNCVLVCLQRTAAGLASPVQTLHCDPLSENYLGASLLAQWQRIHLLMQEMWAQSLAWDDSTRLGAARP